MKNSQKRTVKSILEKSKNVICTMAGGVTNLWVGDPTGITGELVSMNVNTLITEIANEFDTRKLSDLEVGRVADVMGYAIEDINLKLKEGKTIRNDNFFEFGIDDRSDGEEIFEGVIVAAQREFENKKLRYYGKLLSNISFREDISKDQAVQLIQIAQKLSYRQYILIMIIAQSQFMKINNVKSPYLEDSPLMKKKSTSYSNISVYQDIYELYRMGMLNGGGKIILEMGYIIPSELEIQGVGVRLFELMELNKPSGEMVGNFKDYLEVLKVIKHEKLHN
ncbi:MAG: hypothetical protein E6248_14240 [Clostridium sp.]|uniref:hypothetical protein n=1 Tax=Clostridium sp. TaxID=1506 RepID=UPI0029064D74|nr:hypothetical protein [Clostridium sp.]MDU5111598.1 hypothetical protein [Clostridium sp.]